MGLLHVAAWRSAYVGVMSESYLAGLDAAAVGQRWEASLSESTGESTVLVVLRDDTVVAMCDVGPFRARNESRRIINPRAPLRPRARNW
jgi:hypothetical protein